METIGAYQGSKGIEGTLTTEMEECTPLQTEWLKRIILSEFTVMKIVYDGAFKKRLTYEISGDSPSKILEHMFEPYLENNIFKGNREYYQSISLRFNQYLMNFKVQKDLIEVKGLSLADQIKKGVVALNIDFETIKMSVKESREYHELMQEIDLYNTTDNHAYNMGTLKEIVPRLCESIELWYKRTQLWKEKFSQDVN